MEIFVKHEQAYREYLQHIAVSGVRNQVRDLSKFLEACGDIVSYQGELIPALLDRSRDKSRVYLVILVASDDPHPVRKQEWVGRTILIDERHYLLSEQTTLMDVTDSSTFWRLVHLRAEPYQGTLFTEGGSSCPVH